MQRNQYFYAPSMLALAAQAEYLGHRNLPRFDTPTDGGGGGNTPPKTELPPSKFDTPPPEDQQKFDRGYVTELRNENVMWRTKYTEERTARQSAEATTADHAKKVQEAEGRAQTAKTEAEAEVTRQVGESKKEFDKRVMRAELKALAIKEGILDLDGLQFADIDKLKWDEKGENLVGADEVLKALKEAKPYLFGSTSGSSTTKTPPKPGEAKPFDARTASPEEYEAAKKKMIAGSRR